MDVKRRLKRVLQSIEDAVTALRAAQNKGDQARPYIVRALAQLDEAESELKRAMRDIPTS